MLLPIAYEGEGRDGYRDQIVTCDVGVSLNSKTHPLFMKYSNAHSVMHITIPACFLCFFYNPYMSLFHLLVYIEHGQNVKSIIET